MNKKFNTSSKNDLRDFINNKSFKKIFIVAGSKSFDLSGLRLFFSQEIKKEKIKYFFKKNNYPEYNELLEIISEINYFSPDLIIAAGGGSVLDYGKMANALKLTENLDNRIINSQYEIKKNRTKLLAIPTTAGSGAEVTSNAVIYISKIKYSVEGEEIKPDYFFLVTDFIKDASKKIKSSAGFDAIAQGIESIISRKSNEKSVDYAKKSLEISFKYFLKFLKNPNDDHASAMAFAANLSGKAISISKTTAPHAVSYPFTSLFNISHGHAVSLTLNEFLKFNFKNISHTNCDFDLGKRFKLLFELAKVSNIKEFDLFLKNIKKESNLENNFKKLGIDIGSSITDILLGINNQRLLNNPVKVDNEIVKKIILEKSNI